MTCSRSSSPIVNATVSAMAPLWAQGGHFYFGETGHLHLGPTVQRLLSTGYVNLGLCGDYAPWTSRHHPVAPRVFGLRIATSRSRQPAGRGGREILTLIQAWCRLCVSGGEVNAATVADPASTRLRPSRVADRPAWHARRDGQHEVLVEAHLRFSSRRRAEACRYPEPGRGRGSEPAPAE